MITSFFLSVSALGTVKYSPDGRYIAVSEPGIFKVYQVSELLLLRMDFPFEEVGEGPIDVSFNFDDNLTTEILLLFKSEGLIRINLNKLKEIEIFDFSPLPLSSAAYGAGCIYVGTEDGDLFRIEPQNKDHPSSSNISPPLAISNSAIVSLTPTNFYDEGVNIYNADGELLFFSRLDESIVIIEPPLFTTNPDQRWSLLGLDYCWQLGVRSYSGWSATGNLYLGDPSYSVGLRLETEFSFTAPIAVVPLTDLAYLVVLQEALLKLTIEWSELSNEDEGISAVDNLSITFVDIYNVQSGCRIVAAYQVAESENIHVITAPI